MQGITSGQSSVYALAMPTLTTQVVFDVTTLHDVGYQLRVGFST